MARPRARFSPLSRQRPLRSGRFSLMVRRPTAGGRVVTGVAPGLQNRWQALRSAVGSTPMRPRQKAYFRTSPKNFGSRRLERKNLLRSQLQEFFLWNPTRGPASKGCRCLVVRAVISKITRRRKNGVNSLARRPPGQGRSWLFVFMKIHAQHGPCVRFFVFGTGHI